MKSYSIVRVSADVMKSVNMHVSDACGEILAGSSPAVGNKKELNRLFFIVH